MTALKRIVGLSVPVLALSAVATAAETAEAAEATAALGTPWSWWISPIAALAALGFAIFFYKKMIQAPAGTDRMIEIAQYVREGAYAYLFRQYSVVTIVFIVLLAIFAFLAYEGVQNPFVPVAFLTGGFFSGLCGFLGMKTATASLSTRQRHLDRFNDIMARLDRNVGKRKLAECNGRMGWPTRGVYFFFDEGEFRHSSRSLHLWSPLAIGGGRAGRGRLGHVQNPGPHGQPVRSEGGRTRGQGLLQAIPDHQLSGAGGRAGEPDSQQDQGSDRRHHHHQDQSDAQGAGPEHGAA